jgi:hypothetical protein
MFRLNQKQKEYFDKKLSGYQYSQEFVENLFDEFKQTFNDNETAVDMLQEEDWKSLSIGFFVAKGVDLEAAYSFAVFMRYHTNLG